MASWLDGFFENRSWLKIIQYDNNINELTVAGSSISEKPRFTLAKLPPASLVDIGSVVNIPKSEFANNAGIPEWGIDLKSDSFNLVTSYPGQIFSMQDGTVSAPLVAAWTPGSANKTKMPIPGGSIAIPWQLMHVGLRMRVTFVVKFNSASNSAIFAPGFGQADDNSNPYAGWIDTSYAAGKPLELVSEIYVSSSTSYTARMIIKNHPTGTPSAGYPVDNNASLNMAGQVTHYINFFIDPNAADSAATYDMISYKVELIS